MNGRQSKKIRQYYNRNVRQMVEMELRVLTKIIRPRPKRLPTWAWLLLMLVFFQKDYVKKQRVAVKNYKATQHANKKNKNKDTTSGRIQPKDDNKETSGESKGTIKE